MARPLRIQYENAYYHVTCRGNARQKIFSNDADHSTFLDLLERSSDIYQTEILAYVLMSNHFHLFVKTPLGNLQEFMRHFNRETEIYRQGLRRSKNDCNQVKDKDLTPMRFTPESEIAFCSGHKKCQGLLDHIKASKIEIPSIDDVESAWFEDQLIQDGHIVNFPMGNNDNGRDASAQVQEGA